MSKVIAFPAGRTPRKRVRRGSRRPLLQLTRPPIGDLVLIHAAVGDNVSVSGFASTEDVAHGTPLFQIEIVRKYGLQGARAAFALLAACGVTAGALATEQMMQ